VQHGIPVEKLGPLADPMAHAVDSCVHCGFCLPTCPTYQVLGEEMDSPRGRIILMKEVLEGNLELDQATPYLDPCLGCMACVTACPSGVQYGELITPFRALAEGRRKRDPLSRSLRWLVLNTLPFPRRFRLATTLGRLAKPLGKLLRGRLAAMLDLLPRNLPKARPLPRAYPAEGERRARVALLVGCAQQVLSPELNWATLRVLSKNGVEVVIPPAQGCCGALSAHTGAAEQAKRFARRSMHGFPGDVDAILTNAAGCGSGMKEYPLWLKGGPQEDAATEFAGRVEDVSVFLARLGPIDPKPLPAPLKVAYHDACHLAHAQSITAQPRALLGMIPNLELLEIPDGEICCGSAGTYNIEQPEIARELGQRKAEAILSTGAEAVATGNIGCLVQIRAHLQRQGRPLPIYHTIELLYRAYPSPAGTEK
jgi:glycolate oxidase iron-sulfur subunit